MLNIPNIMVLSIPFYKVYMVLRKQCVTWTRITSSSHRRKANGFVGNKSQNGSKTDRSGLGIDDLQISVHNMNTSVTSVGVTPQGVSQ